MVKIVYSTDNYHPRVSGMAISVDRFKKYLERRGHEVHVFAPHYPGFHQDPNRVHRFDSAGLFFSKEDRMVVPWAKKAVFGILDRIGPDIIHVQTEFEMASLTKRYALRNGIPLVMSAHTYYEEYVSHYFPWIPERIAKRVTRWLTQDYYRPADLMICPSPQMREILESYGLRKEIHIVPTGIDTDEFYGVNRDITKEKSLLVSMWPQLRGKRILSYLGRVGREKNVEFLLPVLARVVESCREACLVVTGEGPYLTAMKDEAARMGLADRIVFTGYGDRKLVRDLLALSDVFVFPSLTESQGLVTGEAMVCGTPVVAIGAMGTKWVMGGDNGGYMVPNDINVFADAVVRLLTDEDLWRVKSREAIAHSQQWRMESMAEQMEKLYSQARERRNQFAF